jgi:cytochrome c553
VTAGRWVDEYQMNKFHRFLIGFLIICAACQFSSIQAADTPERGAILADTCLGCHGVAGYRNGYPSYRVPKLGGQKEEYLYLGLQGYKSQGRAHQTMRAQAATLSEQDMRDLASYFASRGDLRTGSEPSGAQLARGREKSVVCAACHGETGISPSPSWPSLAGQHEDYLLEVIWQYKNGGRKDPVMAGQVVNLSADDIEDIAAYYSAQPGLFTTK